MNLFKHFLTFLFICFFYTSSFSQTYFQKAIGGSFSAVYQDSLGYLLSGTTNGFGNGGNDAIYQRLDEFGTVVWSRTNGGVGGDKGQMLFEIN